MRRNAILLLVALFALSGALVAAFGTQAERDAALHGYRNPAEDSDIPYFVPRLGVNADLTRYSREALREQIALMRTAGIVWVRQHVEWADFAQGKTGERYQPIFDVLAEQTKIRLIAVLDDSEGTPPDVADFAQAAAALAQTYGEGIAVYEIWDEPNLGTKWGGSPNPTEYAALLTAAYGAIHAHDSSALVNSAALAPTIETGPSNLSDLRFLESLYLLGLKDFSDGIAAKPYGFSDSPSAAADHDVLNFSRAILLRDIMVRYNDSFTPLWASEWGWNSLPDNWQGSPSIWGNVVPQEQAAYTLDGLRLAETHYPWLGGMILSHWQPIELAADDARWGFAIRDTEGGATPPYNALSAATASWDAAPYGLHRPDNPYARYAGVWTFGALGADIGWVGDSSVEFTFQGEALSLLVRENDYTAFLYATIDGQAANSLPRDADGNAYLLLTSDTRTPQLRLVPVARNLGAGAHTIRIVADRGWDQWALVGFAVGGTDFRSPYNRQIVLAFFSALLAVTVVIVSARRINWRGFVQPLRSALQRLSEIASLALAVLAALLVMFGMMLTWRDAIPDILRREPIQLGIALVTGGLLYLNPAFIVAIAAAAVLFIIFFHKPLLGLTLTLLFTPFFLFPVELYQFAFPMSELLILITLGAWALRIGVDWAQQRRSLSSAPSVQQRSWHLLDVLLIVYLLLGVLSLAWTEYRSLAVTELRTLFAEPLLFYLILRTSRPTQRDIVRLVDALIVSAALVALIGLFQYVRGDAVITAEDGARRLASVYGSPNNVALWLGRAFPFVLAFVVTPIDKRRRLIMAGITLLLLLTLALTLSAGAFFLGIPAVVIVVLTLAFRRRSAVPLLGIGLLAGIAFPFLAQFPRFTRLLEPADGTNFFRIRVWQSAIAMIRDHPITGIGQDQFLPYFQGRYILPDAWQEPNLSHPHNFLLDIWLRLGAAGVLWLAIVLIALVRSLLRSYSRLRVVANQQIASAICIGSLGVLANIFAHGLIDNSLFVNDLIYVFVLVCGIAVWHEQAR